MKWICSLCGEPPSREPAPDDYGPITCPKCGTIGLKIDPASCPHMNHNIYASIARIQKSDAEPETIIAYTADIRIECHECRQPFEFIGLPNGMSYYRPTVSINGLELRAPIAIPGTRPPEGMAGFTVTHQVFDDKEATKQ